MPVRPLRRLQKPTPTLYDEMTEQALHSVVWRADFAQVEREHPELILRRGTNVLAAAVVGRATLPLAYSFAGDRDFIELFPEMFAQLLTRLRRVGAEQVRFRLMHSPSRPRVEPVLKNLWFKPSRDWLEFSIERAPAAGAHTGVRLRPAKPGEIDGIVDEIARIDRESFPNTPMTVADLRFALRDQQLLLAVAGRRIAGFCTYWQRDPGRGYIGTLAVSGEYRGRGIGAALTVRAVRDLIRAGADRVGLTTDQDNTAAIRLYLKLGFRQSRAGRDYTRPTSDAQVRRQQERTRGTLIKFGGWR
ncbi:MAG: GNAT family N-acetyltransferase [Dehalococcoidia bacterium]